MPELKVQLFSFNSFSGSIRNASLWNHFARALRLQLRMYLQLCFFLVGISTLQHAVAQDLAQFPRKPIKVVVPFGAGGGSDTFTRIMQKAIQKYALLPEPIVIINVPGAGGSVGSRRVKNARPDGYTLLQIHEGMLTNQYSGNANFGASAFEPIAGTGQMAHVIAVPANAPYQSINDLMEAATSAPDSIVFAVGIGAPSHFAGLMLENVSPGAKFRFTQSGGGAKRFASLAGGHSEVTTFSVAEYVEFKENGIRALALLSDQRSAIVPEVPTALEQNVDVVSANMHFWWAPKNTPAERITRLAEALEQAMQTPDVQSQLQQLATSPKFLTGTDLRTELHNREAKISQVAQREPQSIPNLSIGLFSLLCLAGLAVWIENRTTSNKPQVAVQETAAHQEELRWLTPLALAATTVAYVVALQWQFLNYFATTVIFFSIAGAMLARDRRTMVVAILLGALLSFSLNTLFTQVLVIDLP